MSTGLIVLAAGASRRMGTPKALLVVDHLVAIEVILDHALALGLTPIVVALAAPHGDAIRARIRNHATQPRIAWNEHPELGMFSSVLAAARAMRAAVDAVESSAMDACLIWPVDFCLVERATIAALIAAAREHVASSVFAPACAGQSGHPILLRSRVLDRLIDSNATANLKDELAPEPQRRIPVNDEQVTRQANTPEEWARAAQDWRASRRGDRPYVP